ncbi:MAG: aspartate--tRNA(Asn) ligase [Nitrososphaerota archaeon]|nr:aspartate--tRNA(Asn) ligase [Nitrososphaerota archaeon]
MHGWVEDQRVLGSLLFMTLRDRTGVAQMVFNRSELGAAAFDEAATVPRQSYVLVSGRAKKSRSRTLPIEVSAGGMRVLGRAEHPLPLDPTGRVESGLDVRLDARPLDLRNPKVAAIFSIKASFLRACREYLESRGFFEVHTPRLIGAAAEGGAELFRLGYFGREACLAQSPQLYKEQLTLSLERVYEIGPYFRAEKMHTTRHLNEFLSLDIEAAAFGKREAMEELEGMLKGALGRLASENAGDFGKLGVGAEVPDYDFPVVTYGRALEEANEGGVAVKFGEDLDAEALKALARRHPGYYFLTDWPSDAKPFYIMPNERDPSLSESFDLMHGALELASGGERVSDRKALEARLAAKGLDPAGFEEHLKAFDWGMPRHAGWGFGVDRLVMEVTGSANIREAVLYPRDSVRLTP